MYAALKIEELCRKNATISTTPNYLLANVYFVIRFFSPGRITMNVAQGGVGKDSPFIN